MIADARHALLLIRRLDRAGAERQVTLLARGLAASGARVTVATYYPGGPLEADLRAVPRVSVVSLDKRGRRDLFGFVRRLRRLVRDVRPDVVYGFLFCGALFALLGTLGRRVRCVWGLRGAAFDAAAYRDGRGLVARVAVRASRFADTIVVNSRRGYDDYRAMGVRGRRMVVIPNGLDLDRFRPDAAGRRRVRAEWGVGPDAPVVGRVGRFDRVKDYPTFLRAAALVARTRPEVRFVCVGDDPRGAGPALRRLARELGIADRVVFADGRADMPAVHSACDVACSTSTSEGCPNVLAEAMACGVPCVATDAGDSARLLGDTGAVVPVGDPARLAAALLRVLGDGCAARGAAARARAEAGFGADRLVAETAAVLWPGGAR